MLKYELQQLCCIHETPIPLVQYIPQQVTELDFLFKLDNRQKIP